MRVVQIKDKIRGIYAASKGLDMPQGYALFEREFRGISSQTLMAYEAFTHKDFEDRLVFPLKDVSGKIRAFIGRHMFSNSGKRYDIKPRHAKIPFFPHNYEIVNGTIIIVEGIFDALNLIDKGVPNVVSIMGLQTLNEKNYKEKLADFKLRGVSKIIILYDGDTPGRKQAEMIEPLLQSENIHTERIDLPDDVDPGGLSVEDVEQLKTIIHNEQNRTHR
jgi:DNA primase